MNLLFDFTADKETKTIHITREFAAGIDLVWDAFTKAEILEKWWAPKPYSISIKELDFREGGRWLYTMVAPENGASLSMAPAGNAIPWSLADFIKIDAKTYFSSKNSFSDENGHSINKASSLTTHSFETGTDRTTVRVEKKLDSLAAFELMASSPSGFGFKEGTAMGFANLDEYLRTLTGNK